MILKGCLCYYSLHKWGLDPSNFEMFGFVIYVHFYHVYLNISNLLEVVSMHKHCPNHFCILDFKMSIVRNESHVPISFFTTLHSLTFDFDFCLTFSWNFFLHIYMSLCLLSVSLIFDQFCDIKYMFKICVLYFLGICLKCLEFTIFQSWCYSLIHYVLIWIYYWWMHGFGNDLEICFVFVLILIQDLLLSFYLWILIRICEYI